MPAPTCPPRLLATSVDCDNAQASINQMTSVYNSLPDNSAYTSAYQSIMDSFNAAWGYGITGPGLCGTVYQIGCQADALTWQMQTDNQLATTTGPTAGDQGTQLPSLTGTLGLIAVIAIAAVIVTGRMK